IGKGKETVDLAEGATDASLTPYHIERGKIFVRERFAKNRHIEVEVLCANIEYTRFPVPHENEGEAPSEYPGLLRASDLIGQLADLSYMRKIWALFTEFDETGMVCRHCRQQTGNHQVPLWQLATRLRCRRRPPCSQQAKAGRGLRQARAQ